MTFLRSCGAKHPKCRVPHRMISMRSKLLIVALFLILAGCGKKGSPTPPVPVVPMATSDLVVTQRGTSLVLTWTYPSTSTAGRPLQDQLTGVSLYRYREELPASLAGKDPAVVASGDHDPTVAPEITLFSRVPAITPQQFQRLRQRIEKFERDELPGVTQGARIVAEIPAEFRAADGRPLRFTYGVVSEAANGRSDLSNLVSIVPVEPALPPANARIEAGREGIELKWDAPTRGVAGAENPTIIGYNVYRGDPNNPESARSPLNPSPIRETTYRDTPVYGSQIYAVTAVSSVGPPRIESDLSTIARVDFRDIDPPPVPLEPVALPEDVAIQIVWTGIEAPDLAGYHVYRRAGRDRVKLTTTPLVERIYRDEKVAKGVSYIYEVTSIDRNGNESAPAAASEVLIPTD